MEGLSDDIEKLSAQYPLNEETRDGCHVCSMEVLDNARLQEVHLTHEKLPKYLENEAVFKRVDFEYKTTYRAWRDLAAKFGKYPSVQEIKSMTDKSKHEIPDKLKSGLKASIERCQQLPAENEKQMVSGPGLQKSYPLTLESRKKRIEKATVLKKDEKRTALENVRKKQEELRKLKEEYNKQAKQIHCSLKEKKADYERKKEACLQNLAKEKNLDLDILKKRGDEVYRVYRQEWIAARETKLKKASDRQEAIRKLQKEEKMAKFRLKESTCAEQRPRMSTESWEKMQIEEVFMDAQKALRTDSGIETAKIFQNKTSEQPPTESEATPKDPEISLKFKHLTSKSKRSFKVYAPLGSRTNILLASSSKLRSPTKKPHTSFRSMKKPQKMERNVKSEDSMGYRMTRETYPSCDELEAKPCGLYWDLKKAESRAKVCSKKDWGVQVDGQPPVNMDQRVVVNPSQVHFANFFPAETKTAYIKMFNTSLNKINVHFKEAVLGPETDPGTIQVWPPDIVKLFPGNCGTFEINFSTVVWGEVEELTGKAWFVTRSPPNYHDLRYLSVDIKCTRANANPVILEKELDFVEKDGCINCVQTKYLTIENRGVMECRVYIKRCFEIPEPAEERAKRRFTPFSFADVDSYSLKSKSSPPRQKKVKAIASNNVTFIIDYLIENAINPFRIFLTRGRILKRMTSSSIPIKFYPHLLDNHYTLDELKVVFEASYGFEKEKMVTLRGSRMTPVLDVMPVVMDLKTLVVGSRGNQFAFTVKNVSNKLHTVKCKFPKQLTKHFLLEPSSALIGPQMDIQFVIRSNLGWSFFEDAKEYLIDFSAVLEFQIDIVPENYPPMKFVVLGTVAHPLALSIVPEVLEFGNVNTMETSCQNFVLINHSMMEHEVGFFNVPEWGVIMPGYGFVKIGPCQTLQLQFQYSPTFIHAGGPGKEALHTFEIKFSTVRMLSTLRFPKPFPTVENIEPKDLYDEMKVTEISKALYNCSQGIKGGLLNDLGKDENILGFLNEDFFPRKSDEEDEEEEGNTEDGISFLDEGLLDFGVENFVSSFKQKRTGRTKGSFSLKDLSSKVELSSKGLRKKTSRLSKLDEASSKKIDNNSLQSDSVDLETMSIASQQSWFRKHTEKIDQSFMSLKGRANVLDPFCELSETRVIFPATPVTSFSIVSIYLSCPSDLKKYLPDCGKPVGPEDDPRPKVKARFEFLSSVDSLQIEPASGTISYGEKIRINLIFRPKISEKKFKKAIQAEKKRCREITSSSKHGISFKTSVYKSLLKEVAIFNLSKLEVLRSVKNEVLRANIKCLIEATIDDAQYIKRTEILNCLACCPLIRPDFVISSSVEQVVPTLDFPPTAAGMKSKITLDIINISWEDIYLRKTSIDLDGTFYSTLVPPESSCLPHNFNKGVLLPPEAFIRFDIVYAPRKSGMHIGSIKFIAKNTVVECKMSGTALVPVYNIHPTFKLIKLETSKHRVEEAVKIENKGSTSLFFNVNSCFEREIYDSAFIDTSILNYSRKVQKGMTKSQEMNFTIMQLIKNYSVNCHKTCRILVEPKKLLLKPGGIGEFKIYFSPPHKAKSTFFTNEGESVISKEIEPDEYVKRVKITLGTSDVVSDWTILGIVQQTLNEKSSRKLKNAIPRKS